ncbi:MAG: hypothetical protein U0S50_00660 [Sphingopyxis sp.]|uniref:hypothetical protein n=1 Tax=Sphingopyxis sp. TaxID=1908224 RepID=UPI002AB89E4D|nr:hypothetical protein [Sphingopyxis sp.]MDZ3830309.1 hypothetical protein [Sphingopyxis sp.]
MIRWSPAAPGRTACPHRRLARLLARMMPTGIELGRSTLRPWASANFVGARHVFPCTLVPDGAPAMAAGAEVIAAAMQQMFGDQQWHVPGHIVADVAIEPATDGRGLTIEMLTVEA